MSNANLEEEVNMLVETSASFAILVNVKVLVVTILWGVVVGIAVEVAGADTHKSVVRLGFGDSFQGSTGYNSKVIRSYLDNELQPFKLLDKSAVVRELVRSIFESVTPNQSDWDFTEIITIKNFALRAMH